MGRWIVATIVILGIAAAAWLLARPGGEGGAGRAVAPASDGKAPAKPGAVEVAPVIAPPAAAGDGGADGYLIRSRTGATIPGTVTATTRGGLVVTARAGADGVFRLRGLPRGETVRIECASPGLLALRMAEARIPRTGFLDLGYVYLGEGQVLEVLAMDGTGRPVEGCTVAVLAFSYRDALRQAEEPETPEATAVTDAAGRAALPPLPPGMWTVEGRAPGFARFATMVNLVEGALRDPLRLILAPGFSLEGRVLHADGKPAAGARVGTFPQATGGGTDAEGRFRIEGLPRGSAGVFVVATRGILENVLPVEIPAPGPVEIRLLPRAPIAGRVVDDASGAAIPGAEVEVSLAEAQDRRRSATATTATGADGAFRFEGLPALPVESIDARKDGYFRAQDPAPPGEGKEWVIRLRKGAVVRGVVRDGSGAPVSLAWVRLSVWKGRNGVEYLPDARSDEAGRYEIPGAPPGRGLLEAGARNRHLPGVPEDTWEALRSGEVPESCRVEVPEEGAVERDLALVPDSRIEGRILHADGTPAPGYVAALQGAGSTEGFPGGTVASGADGSIVLEDLFPGTNMVVAAVGPGGRLGVSAPFDIVESEVLRGVTVTLSAPGSLRGRVLREDGAPAPGAVLRLVPKRYDPERDWEWRNGRSEGIPVPVAADGAFAAENLAPGPWTPVASAPDCLERRAAAVDLGDGEKREGVEVLLAPGFALAGRVLEPSGGPAAGAKVTATRVREADGTSDPDVEAMSGADGQFRIGGLERGTFEVRAARDGFTPAAIRVETGDAPVVLQLGEGLPIQGRAVEQGTGKPAAGVTVMVAVDSGRPTLNPVTTAADGGFELRGLGPGEVDLRFQSESGAFAPRTVRGVAAGTKGLLVEIPRGLAIAGRVEDAGGLPLDVRGLTVALQRLDGGWPGATLREEEIAAGGAFSLGGLAPGKYRLVAGSRTWNDDKGVYAARALEVEAGTENVVLALARGKTITGRVLLADGSTPSEENFEVTLRPSRGGETARGEEWVSVDGSMGFRTDPLPEGVPFDLEARATDGGLAAAARDVLPGATGVVLRLEKGGTIRGRVVDPEGNPLGAAEVSARAARGGAVSETTNAAGDGTFTLEGLAPGLYRVYARLEDRNLAPVEPEGTVAAGAEGVVVKTGKGFEFRARCSSADGKPLPEVLAFVEEFLDGRWEGPFVFPVHEGALLIRGLPKCRVRVRLVRTPGPVDDGDPDPPAGPFEVPGEEAALALPR